MKRTINILLGLMVWLLIHADSYADLYAVVQVSTEDRKAMSHGSGTCIGWDAKHGLIMTAWHVIKNNTGQVTVKFNNQPKLDAKVVAVSQTWDLAALVVKRPSGWESLPFMSLGRNIPDIGDKITIAGFGGWSYRELQGAVTGFCAPSPGAASNLMIVDVSVRNGDSGGAMLSGRGLLVGVLFGGVNGATYGAHCGQIRSFLSQLEVQYPNLIRKTLTIYPLYKPKKTQKHLIFEGF